MFALRLLDNWTPTQTSIDHESASTAVSESSRPPRTKAFIRSHSLQTLGLEQWRKSPATSELIRRYQHQVDLIGRWWRRHLECGNRWFVDTSCFWASAPGCQRPRSGLGYSEFLSEGAIIAKGQIQQIDLGWVNGKHLFNVVVGWSVQSPSCSLKNKRR